MSNPDGTVADTEPLRSPNILTKTESLDTSLHTELGTDEYGSACSTPHVLPKANSSSTPGGATASGGGGGSGAGAVGSRRASEDFNNEIAQSTTVKISEMYVKRVNPESCTASTASEDDTTQTGTEEVSHDSRFPFADAEKSERESELIEKLDGLSRFPEERSSRRESTTDPSLTTAAGPLPEPRLSLLRY